MVTTSSHISHRRSLAFQAARLVTSWAGGACCTCNQLPSRVTVHLRQGVVQFRGSGFTAIIVSAHSFKPVRDREVERA